MLCVLRGKTFYLVILNHIFSLIVTKLLLLPLSKLVMVGCLLDCGVTDDMSITYDCCIAPVGPLVM